ncbi:MAG: hypothetical protein FWD80_07655, partial [Propionibacteriaceae bacterium]|nr:hypothetical protein [Propionibacteriaceae bacterium]
SFMDWTGTVRPVSPVVAPQSMTDRRILAALAKRMGRDIGLASVDDAKHLISKTLEAWPNLPSLQVTPPVAPPPMKQPVLATWRTLLTGSRCLDGASTLVARPPVVVTGPDVAAAAGVSTGQLVSVTGPGGVSVTAPLVVDPQAAAGVVCLPDAPWTAGCAVAIGPAEVRVAKHGGER